MKTWRWIMLGMCLAQSCIVAEEPLQALGDLTNVQGLSEAALLRGEIFSTSGGTPGASRGVGVEIVWWMKSPPSSVAKVMIEGPEPPPGESKLYGAVRGTPTAASLSRFQLVDSKAPDKALIAKTASGEGLFLSPKELQQASKAMGTKPTGSLATEVWKTILLARLQLFLKAGLKGMPATDHNGTAISAAQEIRSLISAYPKVMKRLNETLSGTFFANGGWSVRPSLWWDLSTVEKVSNPSLGAVFVVEGPDSLRVFDLTFFSGHSYFFALSLYEAWPWKEGALVWRLDLLSIPVRSYSLGMDRSIASKMIESEVKAQVKRWQSKMK